jgi:hypothetical protein
MNSEYMTIVFYAGMIFFKKKIERSRERKKKEKFPKRWRVASEEACIQNEACDYLSADLLRECGGPHARDKNK